MSRASRIEAALNEALAPSLLTVTDDSASHAGHNPAAAAGGTHFSIRIVARAFEGLPRVKRHQKVYAALGDEFASGLHAVALETFTPEEAESR